MDLANFRHLDSSLRDLRPRRPQQFSIDHLHSGGVLSLKLLRLKVPMDSGGGEVKL